MEEVLCKSNEEGRGRDCGQGPAVKEYRCGGFSIYRFWKLLRKSRRQVE